MGIFTLKANFQKMELIAGRYYSHSFFCHLLVYLSVSSVVQWNLKSKEFSIRFSLSKKGLYNESSHCKN